MSSKGLCANINAHLFIFHGVLCVVVCVRTPVTKGHRVNVAGVCGAESLYFLL